MRLKINLNSLLFDDKLEKLKEFENIIIRFSKKIMSAMDITCASSFGVFSCVRRL